LSPALEMWFSGVHGGVSVHTHTPRCYILRGELTHQISN